MHTSFVIVWTLLLWFIHQSLQRNTLFVEAKLEDEEDEEEEDEEEEEEGRFLNINVSWDDLSGALGVLAPLASRTGRGDWAWLTGSD